MESLIKKQLLISHPRLRSALLQTPFQQTHLCLSLFVTFLELFILVDSLTENFFAITFDQH